MAVGHHYVLGSIHEEAAAAHIACSAALLATFRATDPSRRPRSPRSRRRRHPARRHWPGCVEVPLGERLLDRSCPTGCKIDSPVQTWLSPVMSSAASQPFYAKLIGSRQSPRLLPLCSPLMHQGSFPRPLLRDFIGTTSPSVICPDRPCPSRAG